MALTIDGNTTLPMMGGTTGGVGMGALGGGVVGLLLGGLLGNKNGGLFGGSNGNDNDVQFDALQNQINSISTSLGAHEITGAVEQVNQNVSGTSRDQLSAIGNLATAQAAANFTTLSSINGLGRDVLASQNQIQLQNLNSFNNLQFQNAQATNQIIAQGTANAAAMSECCCNLKAAITADGGMTRALINDLNVQNLRDSLAAANNKVSNNEQNNYLLTTILAHLKPERIS